MEITSSPTTEKEGHMAASLTPLVSVPASRVGALSGFETRCSCGLVISSSLRTLAEQDAAAHLAYHARKGA
jgi:hypothetical protein